MATYIVIGGIMYLGRCYYTSKIDKLQTQFNDYKIQAEASAKINEAKSWLLNRENSH